MEKPAQKKIKERKAISLEPASEEDVMRREVVRFLLNYYDKHCQKQLHGKERT
jgi:hypothetical protein